jgi:ABC-2 type transport system permease protein
MKGLGPLLKKELKEQFRTYRWLIVGGIFLLFGITTPLMLKYLPEILKFAGDQLTIIDMPAPTAVQSLSEYTGTIGQIGVLVAVLVAMGSIANELRHGTALMTLSKPVSRLAFVTAKLMAVSLTFLGSMIVASIFCYAYTVWLIESADVMAFVGQNALLGLFLIFCLAVTLLFSSLFKNSLAAGGISLAIIVAQAGLTVLPGFRNYLPGSLLNWGTEILKGSSESYWRALGITVVVIIFCIYLAQRTLQRKDL